MAISNRLPTSFHETFSLKRAAIAQVIDVLSKVTDIHIINNKGSLEQIIKEQTSLGPNYAKSMINYARGAGLLSNSYTTTVLCTFIQKYDPGFDQSNTQWLLHYHMSALNGPGPEFWHRFVISRFRTGNKFTRPELRKELEDYFLHFKNKKASNRTIDDSLSVFTNTYVDKDCLGRLGILTGNSSVGFEVGTPHFPSAWAFAYALINHWEAHCNGRVSINLDSLTSESGLASLFLMDNMAVNRTLNELQQAGFVEVYRSAQPYQLLLLSDDKALALQKLYGVY